MTLQDKVKRLNELDEEMCAVYNSIDKKHNVQSRVIDAGTSEHWGWATISSAPMDRSEYRIHPNRRDVSDTQKLEAENKELRGRIEELRGRIEEAEGLLHCLNTDYLEDAVALGRYWRRWQKINKEPSE